MSQQPRVEMTQLKLLKSVFAVNTEHPLTEERLSIGVSLKNNGEFFDDGRQAHFTQRFRTEPPNWAPFTLDVEFGALFVVDPAPLPLERPYYIRQVFARIVFPYLREYVAETTRRGGFVPLIVNQNLFDDEAGPAPEPPDPGGPKWMH